MMRGMKAAQIASQVLSVPPAQYGLAGNNRQLCEVVIAHDLDRLRHRHVWRRGNQLLALGNKSANQVKQLG